MLNIKEILQKVNENGYGVVAIRHLSDDEEYRVGDTCRNSYDWNYDEDHSTYEDEEPVELNGTYGLWIRGFENLDEDEVEEAESLLNRAVEAASIYTGKIAIIAGDSYSYGADDSEVIIKDAEVICIL